MFPIPLRDYWLCFQFTSDTNLNENISIECKSYKVTFESMDGISFAALIPYFTHRLDRFYKSFHSDVVLHLVLTDIAEVLVNNLLFLHWWRCLFVTLSRCTKYRGRSVNGRKIIVEFFTDTSVWRPPKLCLAFLQCCRKNVWHRVWSDLNTSAYFRPYLGIFFIAKNLEVVAVKKKKAQTTRFSQNRI